MNRINFEQNDLALTATMLGFLQSALSEQQKIGAIGGDNYILSGCVVNGAAVGSGYVIIAGELLEFKAGALATYILVREVETIVTIQEGTYKKINRYAEFGTGVGQIAWASIKRIKTNITLEADLTALSNSLTQADAALQQSINGLANDISDLDQQIDINTGAIGSLQTGKANVNHNHTGVYLTDVFSSLGYWNLSSGLQIRFGTWNSNTDDPKTVTFWQAFSHACLVVITDEMVQDTMTLKYADRFIINRSNQVDGDYTRNYIAIGY